MKLIDSDALEKTLKRNFCEDCNSYNGVRCRSCQIGDALDTFEDAPTIEAVPVVHAKWEPVIRADGSADKRLVQCSICGATTGSCSKGNYCHKCGARMDGAE